jgi:Zn-dependent protease with chaperone function
MRALADAVLLAAVAVGSVRSARAMLRACWPRRSPAAAILLWQALGLAGGLAAVGALLAIGVSGPGTHVGVIGGLRALVGRVASGQLFAPHESPLLTAVRLTFLTAGFTLLALLCSVLVVAFADAIGARRRQRELLALLAHGDPKVPGALVIDYPAAAAYCLPGIRSQIVVSVGTLDLLAPAELTAVLAHERAHLRARHDLVLIPFTSLRRAFPRSAGIADAHRTVALLVEMMADDRALRVRGLLPKELATALVRFGTAGADGAPAGALAVAEGELTARVLRLLTPPPPMSRAAQAAIVLTAALVVATPLLLLVTPLRPDPARQRDRTSPSNRASVTIAHASSSISRLSVSSHDSPGSGRPPGQPHRDPSGPMRTTSPSVVTQKPLAPCGCPAGASPGGCQAILQSPPLAGTATARLLVRPLRPDQDQDRHVERTVVSPGPPARAERELAAAAEQRSVS